MGEVAYKKLFSTQVIHNYYTDTLSKGDVTAIPTAETVRVMKNSGMQFRNLNSGSTVLYKTKDLAGTPFIPFANVNLVFALQLLNINEFLNFTDLGTYTPEKLLYFTNKNTPLIHDLDFEILDLLRPTSFTYSFPEGQDATVPTDIGHIKITNSTGDVTPSYPDPDNLLPDADLHYSYPIDFSGMPKGIYEFETWINADPSITKKVYIDNDLARTGAFGIVDILVVDENTFPTTAPVRVYNINFSRRDTFWKYFVIMKSGNTDVGDLTVSIVDGLDQTIDTPYPFPITFTRTLDTIINGVPTATFVSDAPAIPFFEIVKKGLNIEKTVGINQELIVTDIATPSLGLVSGKGTSTEPTEIFVFI